jgi:hypothetical protein
MDLVKVQLNNVGRFRGTHSIDLSPENRTTAIAPPEHESHHLDELIYWCLYGESVGTRLSHDANTVGQRNRRTTTRRGMTYDTDTTPHIWNAPTVNEPGDGRKIEDVGVAVHLAGEGNFIVLSRMATLFRGGLYNCHRFLLYFRWEVRENICGFESCHLSGTDCDFGPFMERRDKIFTGRNPALSFPLNRSSIPNMDWVRRAIATVPDRTSLTDSWAESLDLMEARKELRDVGIDDHGLITLNGRGLEGAKRDLTPNDLDTLAIAACPALSAVLQPSAPVLLDAYSLEDAGDLLKGSGLTARSVLETYRTMLPRAHLLLFSYRDADEWYAPVMEGARTIDLHNAAD